MKKIICIAVLFLVLAGCTQPAQPVNEGAPAGSQEGGTMADNTGGSSAVAVVENGDKIKVEYEGRFPDTEEVFDKSEGRGPLEFTVGAGQMIAGFDEAVVGMKLNEEKTVTIPPEKAYGTLEDAQLIEAPIENINGGENVEVGSTLTAQNGMQGTVIEINDGVAKISFAHPLAGKTLEFWIKVVEIEKA